MTLPVASNFPANSATILIFEAERVVRYYSISAHGELSS